MLIEAYVEMPFDSDPVARALYNSGRYSQYAMTVSLTGGVLASLAAAEKPTCLISNNITYRRNIYCFELGKLAMN